MEAPSQQSVDVDMEVINNYRSQVNEEEMDGNICSKNTIVLPSNNNNNNEIDEIAMNEEKDSSVPATATISFLNAASRQIREISKQVFRQNATTSISTTTIPDDEEEIGEAVPENWTEEKATNMMEDVLSKSPDKGNTIEEQSQKPTNNTGDDHPAIDNGIDVGRRISRTETREQKTMVSGSEDNLPTADDASEIIHSAGKTRQQPSNI